MLGCMMFIPLPHLQRVKEENVGKIQFWLAHGLDYWLLYYWDQYGGGVGGNGVGWSREGT
jgi:hypothetical protein